jgi:hypothetical protein
MGEDFRADLVVKITHLSPGSLEPKAAIAVQPGVPPLKPEIAWRSIY